MKNPCKICILQVTCTAICDEKENYQALLATAIKQNMIHAKTGNPGTTKFVNYCQKRNKSETEMMKISIRKYEKTGGSDDPISRQVRKSFRDAQSAVRPEHYKSNL